MIDTLKTLCGLSGVSGSEDAVRSYIIGRVTPYADEIVTDAMGNVLVQKKGAKTPDKIVMLCAHMDEVGVLVTDITSDGYLKFATVGSVDERVLPGKSVKFGTAGKSVYGVIACKATHLYKSAERQKAIKSEDMYIDIGAASLEEAQSLVQKGDSGAFDGAVTEFGDGFFKAKAIDDRFGCAVMLELIESELPIDCSFAFTVQEEVGLRGAYTATYRVSPDIAIVLEATTAADMPSVPAEKKVCKLGGGAVIPFMDGGAIYDRELYKTLTTLADANGISWQTKNVIAGGTDAAAVQRSRAGVKTAAISLPTRNLHSPSCVGKIYDMDAVLNLVRKFLEDMGAR